MSRTLCVSRAEVARVQGNRQYRRAAWRGLVPAGVAVMIPPVSRYMTSRPHVVTSHDSLSRARELMTTHAIRHLPVVDDGTLVGIVSANDLDRTRSYDEHVSDAMTSDVTRVDEGAPLDQAVTLMNEGRLGSLVVTSKTGITGIFTTTDAMRALAEILRSNAASER